MFEMNFSEISNLEGRRNARQAKSHGIDAMSCNVISIFGARLLQTVYKHEAMAPLVQLGKKQIVPIGCESQGAIVGMSDIRDVRETSIQAEELDRVRHIRRRLRNEVDAVFRR